MICQLPRYYLYKIIHLWRFLLLFCLRGCVGFGCLVIFRLFSGLRSIRGWRVRRLFLLFTIRLLHNRRISILGFIGYHQIFQIHLTLLFSCLIFLIFIHVIFCWVQELFEVRHLGLFGFSLYVDQRQPNLQDLRDVFLWLLFICYGYQIFFFPNQ